MEKCYNFFKYLQFMHEILKDIEGKLEAESYVILKEIDNIKNETSEHHMLARKWIEKQDFNKEEKQLLLDLSAKVDSFLQNKKNYILEKKELEKYYTNDEFLIYYRFSNHFKNIEKVTFSLIVRFQIIDRMKQQMSHIIYVLEEILKKQELDENGFPKFLDLFDTNSDFFKNFKSLMNTIEEKEKFYKVFGIKIDENREDEIFEAF